MKKVLALLLLNVLIPGFLFAENQVMETMANVSGGAAPTYLPEKVNTDQVSEARNVRFDQKRGILKRKSITTEFTHPNSTGTYGQWNYFDTSGNEWLVRLDRMGNLYASGKSSSYTVTIATWVSTTERTDCAEGLNGLWCNNKENGLMFINTNILTQYSNAPHGGSIEIWRNRVWVADIEGEQSSVRASGELAGDDWNNDSRFSTSPVSFRIGGVNDGNRVIYIKVGQDEMVTFKRFAKYAIFGNDQRDFGTRQISDQVGSISPESAAMLGSDMLYISNRGLEKYTPPTSIVRISDPVQEEIDNLVNSEVRTKSLTLTSQADWRTGTSNPSGSISTIISTNDIIVGNRRFEDTFFVDGSTDNSNAAVSGGRVRFSGSGTYTSATFDGGSVSATWVMVETTITPTGNTSVTSDQVSFRLENSTDGSNWSAGVTLSTSVDSSSYTIRSQYGRIKVICNGVAGSFDVNYFILHMLSTGTYRRDFALGENVSAFGILSANYDLNHGTITFKVQSSPDGVFFSTGYVTQIIGNQITAPPLASHLSVLAVFDSSSSFSLPIIYDMTLNWRIGIEMPPPIGRSFQDRYFLFYTTGTQRESPNNMRLIYDRNRVFTQDIAVNVGGASIHANRLMIGHGDATGKVYSVDTSTSGSDDGVNTDSYVKFRRLDFGDPEFTKTITKFYLTVSRDDVSKSHIFGIDYYVDGATTPIAAENVEISTGVKMITKKSEVCKVCDMPVQGHYFDVRVREISTNTPPYIISRLRAYATKPDQED